MSQSKLHLNSSAAFNLDTLLSLSTGCAKPLDGLDDIHSLDNFAENDMFTIEPAGNDLSSAKAKSKSVQ